MTEAIIILMNMRGGCATIGDKVHTLFRVTGRGRSKIVPQATDEMQNSSRPSEPVVSK